MSARVCNNTTHSDCWCALEQAICDNAVCIRDSIQSSRNSQDTVVNALNYFADSGTHTSLVTKVCDVLTRLSDDDTSFLGRHDGTNGQVGLAVLFLGARSSIFCVQAVHSFCSLVDARVGRCLLFVGRHVAKSVWSRRE